MRSVPNGLPRHSYFLSAGYLYANSSFPKKPFPSRNACNRRMSPKNVHAFLSVNGLLYMRVDLDHLVIQVTMVTDHHFGVPG